MGIILSNGVTNLKNTPSAITDVIANRPVASSVSEGCIFISTDTAEMYSNVSSSWVLIGGGGGGTSTGINGLNGTTNIGLGGTLLNDTSIDADNFSLNIDNIKILNFNTQNGDAIIMTDLVDIKTKIQGLDTGISISGTNARLGYYANDVFVFDINSSNQYMATVYNQNYIGLYIDFTGFSTGQVKYILGDQIGVTGNASHIEINGTLDTIFLKTGSFVFSVGTSLINVNYNGIDNGLSLDFHGGNYLFGDFGITGYGLAIDVTNAQTNLFCSTIFLLTGNPSGFSATGNQSNIGDVDGTGNSTIFGVDDNSQTLVATNVITNSIGLPTRDNLKIRINGNDYVIPLYNP